MITLDLGIKNIIVKISTERTETVFFHGHLIEQAIIGGQKCLKNLKN